MTVSGFLQSVAVRLVLLTTASFADQGRTNGQFEFPMRRNRCPSLRSIVIEESYTSLWSPTYRGEQNS
ncbi:hypothetical protein CLAFUW4_20052 [Fulvia fulva]|uniref:uncharacterized protein n=1 Tax=Passalora fulva TaxID=5499 RepID=UPI002852C324|nr:uncharacterized protein CLAFUR5_20052 [Fulvia fulva]KAK4621693.1 hypothetical protein CLAFUR4_20052 [Fulvia fulva]KAK4623466.1 hypothetical protein CLAFUR0_20052 [Fulvia fulva]WMI38920.1 hypothetical protein CLAFUR5_20052 [Fulvia fulva]WPV16365.1 hypothetical protein CLAFUW4_20052 [Fulvia fulva]WPV31097.1 hypothetical protein CLAFUW7_20052 [Fulvia fulva]